MAPHSSTLAWKIPWTEDLVGCSPWGSEESDMIERLHFHSSLSCIGEGNGNPLQCSCLENPRDRGAWWAAVYGVAQSRTRLKQLSSSSSNQLSINIIIISFDALNSKHNPEESTGTEIGLIFKLILLLPQLHYYHIFNPLFLK